MDGLMDIGLCMYECMHVRSKYVTAYKSQQRNVQMLIFGCK